ncbi:hypothetical protein Y032_0625g804 [Ancylostoma ceylanicum]|uniref:ABC transporter domain-containing protein n=1 Tax=Ancylostoma ceylanicum TaxID=53326 RepID=A0A016WLP0_9BILA|nr:hypothetical protein Y032_0625g804 [Ancylostoma ceylanicum]
MVKICSLPWQHSIHLHIFSGHHCGYIFHSLHGNKLTYELLTSTEGAAAVIGTFTPVFSDEIEPFSLTRINNLFHSSKLATSFGYCLAMTMASQNETALENTTVNFIYGSPYRYEYRLDGGKTLILMGSISLVFAPILICTAMSAASEKETGIKEFLLVMGLGKITLFLETLTFLYCKAFICTCLLLIILVSELPDGTRLFVCCASLLLALAVVLTAMVCAAFVKTRNGAFKYGVVVYVVLVSIKTYAPNIFYRKGVNYLLHVSIFLVYERIIDCIRLSYVRGVDMFSTAMYHSSGIISLHQSFCILIVHILALVFMLLLLEYLPAKSLFAWLCKHVESKKLTQSRDEESSWHQTERRGSTEPDIIVDNVSKIWERTGELAVHEFSLKAYPGDVTVLLGHNGAGKSTTYAMICGTTPATRGTITVCGLRIDQNLNECRKKMGFCPQNNCIFFHLTVDDHLWFFFKLKGGEGDWQEEASDLCEKLKMENIRGRMAGKLSGGEKRKLCVAMAFIGGSRLVMLDEPTAGMDPQSRRNVEVLVEKEKTQRCLLLTTHYMDEAEAMGDFVYIMQLGHSICSGTPLFLKKKFASEYIFNIALDVKRKGNETFIIEKLVKSFVPDSKMSDVNGRQLCFKLPKEAQKSFGDLFQALEEKKQELFIDSFGVSITSLEDVFLKVGKLTEKSATTSSDPEPEENQDYTNSHLGCPWRFMQQIYYICLKKVLALFPTSFVFAVVLVYNTSDWLQSWSLQWPWVAGGVIVGSNTSQSNDSNSLVWLIPGYLNHREITMLSLICDTIFATGNFTGTSSVIVMLMFHMITLSEFWNLCE